MALLRRLPPEISHSVALNALELAGVLGLGRAMAGCPKELPTKCMGLDFINPVGIAAGLDKSGDYIDGLARTGVGFIEIGSVTPRVCRGSSDRPRLHRLRDARAIVNRMGFNNAGAAHAARCIHSWRRSNVANRASSTRIGVSIGKQPSSSLDEAERDYREVIHELWGLADYFAVNLSSPNSPGLRNLQSPELLAGLLEALEDIVKTAEDRSGQSTVFAVKLAPDIAPQDWAQIADIISAHAFVRGLICTNTTVERPGGVGAGLQGGLSGAPLSEMAQAMLIGMRALLPEHVDLLASGGLMSPEDVVARQAAGAKLFQLYTGLVYEGVGLIGDCVEALQKSSAADE